MFFTSGLRSSVDILGYTTLRRWFSSTKQNHQIELYFSYDKKIQTILEIWFMLYQKSRLFLIWEWNCIPLRLGIPTGSYFWGHNFLRKLCGAGTRGPVGLMGKVIPHPFQLFRFSLFPLFFFPFSFFSFLSFSFFSLSFYSKKTISIFHPNHDCLGKNEL